MSLMNRYADIYGIDYKEVSDWVNRYANKIGLPDGMEVEATKDERIQSIKAYIQQMVDQSVTEQVKSSIQAGRIKDAIPIQVDIVPF